MKETGILFTAPMVRALPPGPKTMTRRICKQQPYGNGFAFEGNEYLCHNDYLPPSAMLMDVYRGGKYICATSNMEGWESECPYGLPGDRLWVRETFYAWGRWETRFSAKKGRDEWHFVDMTLECGRAYVHAADGLPAGYVAPNRGGVGCAWWKRPAIFMPRAASRITLEITSVRVERLSEISEADARAEGAPPSHPSIDRISREFGYADFPRSWYAQLWDEINGPGSWDANPWVWVVGFRRLP